MAVNVKSIIIVSKFLYLSMFYNPWLHLLGFCEQLEQINVN